MSLLERFQKENKPKISVEWITLTNGEWPELYRDIKGNLSSWKDKPATYVIWSLSKFTFHPKVIKVGKSEDLTDRLLDYLNVNHDSYKEVKHRINDYFLINNPFITWATIPQQFLAGAEKYLGRVVYQPLISERFDNVPLVKINPPFLV